MLRRSILSLLAIVSLSLGLCGLAAAQASQTYLYIMLTGTEGHVNGGTTATGIAANMHCNSTGLVYSRPGAGSSGAPLQRYGLVNHPTDGPVASWSPTGTQQCGSVWYPNGWWITGVEFDIVSQVLNGSTWSDVIHTHNPAFSEINHHCIFACHTIGAPPPPTPQGYPHIFWAGPELTDFILPAGYGINVSNKEIGPAPGGGGGYHWWNPSSAVQVPMPVTAATPQLFLRVCIHNTNINPGQDVKQFWTNGDTFMVPQSPQAQLIIKPSLAIPSGPSPTYSLVAAIGHVHDHCDAFDFVDSTTLATVVPVQYPKNLLREPATHENPGAPNCTHPYVGPVWHTHSVTELPPGTSFDVFGFPANPGHLPVKGLSPFYFNPPLQQNTGTTYLFRAVYWNPHPFALDNMTFMAVYWF